MNNQNREAVPATTGNGPNKYSFIVSQDDFLPDFKMAKHFLDTLDDRGQFSYQLFPEETGSKQKPMILHGAFQEVCSQLHAANQQGSGIFVTINRTDRRGRKKENILATRAVFVDLDGAPLQPVREAPLMPHMIIESSPGKFHAYWMIEHLPLEEFTRVQKWLAEKFDGDTQVCDLSRCMRLPGFHHLKGDPFLTSILEVNPKEPIDFSLFKEKMGITENTSKASDYLDNEILQALHQHKMILNQQSHPHGCWTIKCPWEHLHSKQDCGTKYYEPHTNGYANHGFQCFHSHCQHKTAADLLDFLSVEKKAKGNYPQPLFRELPPAPPFPIEALGESLENVVRSLHRVVKAPMSLCAQSVLGCVGLVVQPYFNITIDGRKHPLALYMISVGESGERKTGIDNIVLDVVRSFEKMMVHEFNNEQRKYKTEQDIYKLKRRRTLDKNASFEELESISPPQEPLDPVMIIPEPTFPALIVHLTKGTPSVGIFSSEGGQLFGGHAMREENIIQAATGFSLLWDKGEINRARVSDGIYNLYGKRVGLNLMIQPIIAEKFFSNEVLMGQGFLSRCLICWPSSTIGTRLYRKENLFEDPAIKEFNLKIGELLDQTLPLTDQTKNELNPRNLSLEEKGYEAWVEFHDWVESRMAPKGKLHSVKAFGSKAAENALRIAGILFGYDHHKNISSDETISIPAYYIENAIRIMKFYLEEALRIQGISQLDKNLVEANKLLEWIKEKDLTSFPLHHITQKGPNAIRDTARARRLLNILVQHGRITEPKAGEWDGRLCKEMYTFLE